jgi:hypothetical protein
LGTYVYIDGESHFIRSRECWKTLHGEEAELENIKHFITKSAATQCYPDPHNPLIQLKPRSKFFWDKNYPCLLPSPFSLRRIDGAAYFTDFAGDDGDHHDVSELEYVPDAFIDPEEYMRQHTFEKPSA